MSVSSLVDKIYVMAIPDRINYITKILKDHGIDFEIVSAILAKDIDIRDLISKNIVSKKAKVTKNQVACYLTFKKTLDNFLSTGSDKCILFEDDLKAPKIGINYYEKIRQLLEETPKDFDIIYMGRCYDNCCRDQKITKNVSRCFEPKCNHAVIISKKGAEKLKNILKTLPDAKDITISRSISKGDLIAYAATPALFYQDRKNVKSTLRNDFQSLPICEKCNIIEGYREYSGYKGTQTKVIIIGGVLILLILVAIIIVIKVTKKK